MSTVTTTKTPSLLAGASAAGLGVLAFGLSLPLSAFAGLVAAFVGARLATTVVETDGTTLTFEDDAVTIVLPDGTAAVYTLQELADAAAAANALPAGGTATAAPVSGSSTDDAALLAEAVRLGATLLG